MRGRTHLLPYDETVTSGAQPEVVEIAAPGHEGRRFWITFDHPITLATDLPAGRGVVEATEEQKVIALGGKALEGAPPFAAEGEPNDKAAPEASRHAGAHRHGGALKLARATSSTDHTAAETAPVPAAAPAPETPPPLKPAPALAKADSPPAPNPTSTVAAKVETPPAVRPKPASGVDPVKTQVFVKSHLGEVQRCYERGKMDEPDLKGRVTLKILIAESGAVTSATVESSTLRSSVVESCIATTVKGWKFPAPIGGPAVISYPFNLK
jgi:outer membrane biosynthesis protein TonB